MRIDKRAKLEIERLIWKAASRIYPREELAPRDDYPPPPEGLGGGDTLVVKPSLVAGAGLGLFTTQRHSAYEVMCLYTGERLTLWEAVRTRDQTYFAHTAAGLICARRYLGMKARFVNHHFDPTKRNVALINGQDKDTIFGRCLMYISTRPIEAGEELYTDYGPTYWIWNRHP